MHWWIQNGDLSWSGWGDSLSPISFVFVELLVNNPMLNGRVVLVLNETNTDVGMYT